MVVLEFSCTTESGLVVAVHLASAAGAQPRSSVLIAPINDSGADARFWKHAERPVHRTKVTAKEQEQKQEADK
jgi:hypothetical protein